MIGRLFAPSFIRAVFFFDLRFYRFTFPASRHRFLLDRRSRLSLPFSLTSNAVRTLVLSSMDFGLWPCSRHRLKSMILASYYRAIVYYCILRDDDDAVADEVRTVWAISFEGVSFVNQLHAAADARVLIDDRALNDCIRTHANAWKVVYDVPAHLFKRLIIVCAHHVSAVERCTLGDATAQTNHGTIDVGPIDNATIAENRIANFTVVEFRRGQIARTRK